MVKIDAVAYGEMVIEGRTYYSDLVVWCEGKPALLEKTHLIDLSLLEKIMKKKPETVVIGIGLEGTVKIDPKVRERLKKEKIGLFIDKTENAVEIFNAFVSQGKKVVGIMHVTL